MIQTKKHNTYLQTLLTWIGSRHSTETVEAWRLIEYYFLSMTETGRRDATITKEALATTKSC